MSVLVHRASLEVSVGTGECCYYPSESGSLTKGFLTEDSLYFTSEWSWSGFGMPPIFLSPSS